jgi:hypothetical protein
MNKKYLELTLDGRYISSPRHAVDEVIDLITESGAHSKGVQTNRNKTRMGCTIIAVKYMSKFSRDPLLREGR